jgi:hypothetical protein
MDYIRAQENLFSLIEEFDIKTDLHIVKNYYQGIYIT